MLKKLLYSFLIIFATLIGLTINLTVVGFIYLISDNYSLGITAFIIFIIIPLPVILFYLFKIWLPKPKYKKQSKN